MPTHAYVHFFVQKQDIVKCSRVTHKGQDVAVVVISILAIDLTAKFMITGTKKKTPLESSDNQYFYIYNGLDD